MKRTAKILSVVLALALVFGAIAIVSSADVTGLPTKISANYNGVDKTTVYDHNTANATLNSTFGYTWNNSGRSGTAVVGVSQDDSENQYLIVKNTAGASTSGPYFGTGYGGANLAGRMTAANGVVSKGTIDVENHPYLIMDLDVIAPTANWNANIGLQLRTFKAEMANGVDVEKPGLDTCEAAVGEHIATQSVIFATDTEGTYISDKTGTYKMYVNPYEFTHVTIIYESVAKEDFRSVNLHVYVDGEYFYSYEGNDAAGGKGVDGYYAVTPNLSYDEIRFNWSPVAKDATVVPEMGLDNVITRFADSSYNGNLAEVLAAKTDLTAWESNLYDEANMPFGFAVAEVAGVKYEDINAAIAAVADNGTLKLLSDLALTVEINKAMTIELNGFTADFKAGEGLALDLSTEGIVKVGSSVGKTTYVLWDECLHDPMCEDEYEAMHPLFFEAELALNEKFLDAYNPTFFGKIGDSTVLYALAGWKNAETGEMITADSAVTADDVSMGFVMLEPVYEVTVKNFEYTQGGVLKESFDNTLTLKQVIAAADAGSTIKLCSDFEVKLTGNASYIDIGKKLTLDLNGFSLKAYNTDSNKSSLFRMTSGTDFTLTSSVEGGKLFNTGWSGNNAKNAGTFNWPNDEGILRIKGNDAEGNNTLAVFTGNLIQGYSKAAQYFIDGGIFACNGSDQMGFIDTRKAGRDSEIKNAIFYVTAHGSGLLGYGGRDAALTTDADPTVVVDNCVIIGSLTNAGFVAPQKAIVTNTYVTGSVNPVINSNYKAISGVPNVPGTVIIGEGCYFGTAITNANVELAEGVKLYDIPATLDVNYLTNTFKKTDAGIQDSSFVANEVSASLAFIQYATAEEIQFVDVIWKNAAGEVIGQNKSAAGFAAVAPADLKASQVLVPGWLNAVPAEWNESLIIPEGVTEYVITAKEGGKVIPVVAVQLYFNIRLTTHFEYHAYIPEVVDGIEVIGVDFRGDRLARYQGYLGTKYNIDGKTYTMVDAWPGFNNAANENASVGVTFTYEGKEYKVAKNINIVEYCDYILNFVPAEGQADYKPESRALAANTANYLYKGLILGGANVPEALKTLVENNTSLLYTIDKENLKAADFTAASKYISKVELAYSAYSPYFYFYLTEAGKAAKITLSCGVNSNTDTPEEIANLGYIANNHTVISAIKSITMTVTPAEGEAEEFVFTLEMYYDLLAKSGADAKVLDLVDAMYGYAVCQEKYIEK